MGTSISSISFVLLVNLEKRIMRMEKAVDPHCKKQFQMDYLFPLIKTLIEIFCTNLSSRKSTNNHHL